VVGSLARTGGQNNLAVLAVLPIFGALGAGFGALGGLIRKQIGPVRGFQ
jgi:hypothetical protein